MPFSQGDLSNPTYSPALQGIISSEIDTVPVAASSTLVSYAPGTSVISGGINPAGADNTTLIILGAGILALILLMD